MRYLIKEFCNCLRGNGKVCDLGCGPGHITRFIKDQGIDVCGIDISDGMLRKAKEKNPDIEFIKGNILELKPKKKALQVSFYIIQ
ncbi:class I SAM-dependent methyltransferase [Mobilitalea sibirica]|uniref:Class I SAM-dependent methyltransferase n=1 Tax=Mobilitalea sibirica TaxID=1462919 RepID=A0A8J7GYY5_9FIRM|nr:class I SAM-dependent methyltransferase [Mobilitalea sibirica]MBH1940914.1 class I SAM-dependent methyltransferase [Mobilitalea sibirica]